MRQHNERTRNKFRDGKRSEVDSSFRIYQVNTANSVFHLSPDAPSGSDSYQDLPTGKKVIKKLCAGKNRLLMKI